MEGLMLIIGLIVWFASSLKKKTKADQERIRAMQERASQLKRERFAKMEREAQQMQTTLGDQTKYADSPVAAEGEPAAKRPESQLIFSGSLPDESMEGECICQAELEHNREIVPLQESVYANEITASQFVDVSPRGIMQAVVMNEILTRPKQRIRRY